MSKYNNLKDSEEDQTEELKRELMTNPHDRYDRFPGIESLAGKSYVYNMQGVPYQERMAMVRQYPDLMGLKNINPMMNRIVADKEYRKIGVYGVMAAYGKWYKRLIEISSPGEMTRQRKIESHRRRMRAEARYVANTMLFKNQKHFKSIARLI